MIKFGDIQYFTLLRLQSYLRAYDFKKLPLNNYYKLQMEVEILIEAIHLAANEKAKLDAEQKIQK